MNRRSRVIAAFVALATLLFAQLALPAHGCPRVAQMDSMTHAAIADETASTDAVPCERHCVESAKSFDMVKPIAAAPAAAIAAPVRAVVVVATPRRAAPFAASSAAGPAPPFPRSTVLRI